MSFSPVFLTNPRNVEKVEAVKNVSLTTTVAQTFTVDTRKYKQIYIIADSTHDADIDLKFRPVGTKRHSTWNGAAWEVSDTVILPKNDTSYKHINTALPYLNNLVTDSISIRVAALSVPTTGLLNIIVMGVLN